MLHCRHGCTAHISIHAPREGCDLPMAAPIHCHGVRFQSTHPVRGATPLAQAFLSVVQISIHAPREGCDLLFQPSLHVLHISIHAPREGCDVEVVDQAGEGGIFQSTHPVRGATRSDRKPPSCYDISIHAPREGCDRSFYSNDLTKKGFQSTHPVRGATEIAAFIGDILSDFNPRTP